MKSQPKRSDPWPVAHLRKVAQWIRITRGLDFHDVAWCPTYSIEPQHIYAIDHMRVQSPRVWQLWQQVVDAGYYPVIDDDYIYLDRDSYLSGEGQRWHEPMYSVEIRRRLLSGR